MAKPSRQTIIEELVKEIELGKTRANSLSKVVKKWHMSSRTFDRLWKIANTQHLENQEKIKEKISEVNTNAAIEERKKHIMTAQERKMYLTMLIHGEIQVPYSEVKYNPAKKKFETIQFVELPSHQARINAISELNKMEGDYAPTKISQTDSKGKDIPLNKFTDSDLNALASIIKRAQDA